MASARTKDDPTAKAIVIPLAEGDDPWTTDEVEEIRQELLADIARMERAIEVAEAGLADLFEEGTDGAGRDPADVGSSNFERDQEMSLAEVLPGDPVGDPVTQVISSEELRSLVECLGEALSDLESGVLTMYLEGRSYEEIAGRLDCTPKTVDNALQRVKRKVLTHLRGREVLDLR